MKDGSEDRGRIPCSRYGSKIEPLGTCGIVPRHFVFVAYYCIEIELSVVV
jgi:hypothetical protein